MPSLPQDSRPAPAPWQRGIRKAFLSFRVAGGADPQDDLSMNLEQAIDTGDTDAVRKLIQSSHVNLDTKGRVSGMTPLMFAIRHDFEVDDVITIMLNRRGTAGNINALDNSGRTAISYAVQKGDAQIVKCLLEHRAHVDQDILHFLPETVTESTLAIAETLIQAGASLDARDESGKTPLIAACAKTMFFGEKDCKLVSPFAATAASKWQQEIIKLLLDTPRGLEMLNEGDLEGKTPLMHSVDAGVVAFYDPLERGVECQCEIVSLLLDRGANVNAQDRGGRTALWIAVLADTPRLRVVRLLMDRGADIRVLDVDERRLLSEALVKHGRDDVPVVKLLLEHDANHSSQGKSILTGHRLT
ncbi:Ankyrin repeat-containing domain protein [Naviculisporaceae sp. PSN 640]